MITQYQAIKNTRKKTAIGKRNHRKKFSYLQKKNNTIRIRI
jgi:hypothetical protein